MDLKSLYLIAIDVVGSKVLITIILRYKYSNFLPQKN